MTHVVTKPITPFRTASGKLEVHQIPAATDNLIWLVVTEAKEAAAVDGPDAGAVRESMRVVGPLRAAADVPGITEKVDDGDAIEFGGVTLKVLLTEGHINGHISFVTDGVVFCGDTLFGAGCGYLFDGPPAKMHRSLERLAALPGETRVACAHEYTMDNLRFAWSVEPDNRDLAARIRETRALRAEGGCSVPSTIDLERRTNPFLRHASKTLRERVSSAMPERSLGSAEETFAATRALKDRKDYKSITDAELSSL